MKTIVLLLLTTSLFSLEFSDIKASCDKVLPRMMYTTCYNTTVKMPNFSFYKVTNTSADVTMTRLSTFYVDPDLDKSERSNSDDYDGYDKGHLVPASIVDVNETSRKEGNYYSNVVPQDVYLNRFGAWRDFERLEQLLVNQNPIDIMSGALYYKDSNVPKYMYKVIVVPNIKKYVIVMFTNTSIETKYKYDYIMNIDEFTTKSNIILNIPSDYSSFTKEELSLIRP